MSNLKKQKFTVAKDRFLPGEYFRNGDWHWSYNVILIGVFSGFFSFFFVGNITLIHWETLLKAYLFLALVPLLIPYKFQRSYLKVERLEMILLYVLGIGPIILSSLLWSNFLIHDKEERIALKISHIQSVGSGISPSDVELVFEEDFYEAFPKLKIHDHLEVGEGLLEADSAIYTVSNGLFGYKVITSFDFK